MTVFYLKINNNTEVAIECFRHWVGIVKAFGADYYIVCDNKNLEAKVRSEENKDKFITSDKRAKEILTGVISFFWLNTGAALLTPFIHAKEHGYSTFYNIDADDTVMCCAAEKAAETLKLMQQYADGTDLNCISLDMHSTISEHFYKHWSFGVTYTKLEVDYISEIKKYNARKPELGAKDMLRVNNIDELFTNLTYLSIINTNVFNIENLYFAHVPQTMHVCENGYWKFLKRSHNFKIEWPMKIGDKVEIPESFVILDAGISKEDSRSFLQENQIFECAMNNPLSPDEIFNLRKELAKSFELFRKDENTPIYLFAGYYYFFYKMGSFGQRTGYNLLEDIEGFIDSNPARWHQKMWNIEIYAPDQIREDSFIVIPTELPHVEKQVVNQLKSMGLVQYYHFCLDYELEFIIKRAMYARIRKFQNLHQGKRCFIVGNGPSLSIHDLETLKKNEEIVLVSNNFSEWFGQTDFRPDYYFLADMSGVKKENEYAAITEPNMTVFSDVSYNSLHIRYPDNLYYFEQNQWMHYTEYPYKVWFSDDIALSYAAGSITYVMLQMAVNMGFNEVYLLGMDNVFPTCINHKGELVINNEVSHHFHKDNIRLSTYTKDMFESAYAYAKDYCEKKGVKIFNSTRGGALEVFERVDFNSLF